MTVDDKWLESRWPKSDDSLFAAGPDWKTEAQFAKSWDWSPSYAVGYREAAQAVIEAVEARRLAADSVVFPVFSLYWQYVELMLKGLITVGNQLERRGPEYPKHHDIRKLWQRCRPLLESACPEGERAPTDIVEKLIDEMASMDPSGSGKVFRYAEDKHGQPTLPTVSQVDLGNVRAVMNRMSGFLEGSYDCMDAQLQYQADIDSEYSE